MARRIESVIKDRGGKWLTYVLRLLVLNLKPFDGFFSAFEPSKSLYIVVIVRFESQGWRLRVEAIPKSIEKLPNRMVAEDQGALGEWVQAIERVEQNSCDKYILIRIFPSLFQTTDKSIPDENIVRIRIFESIFIIKCVEQRSEC